MVVYNLKGRLEFSIKDFHISSNVHTFSKIFIVAELQPELSSISKEITPGQNILKDIIQKRYTNKLIYRLIHLIFNFSTSNVLYNFKDI